MNRHTPPGGPCDYCGKTEHDLRGLGGVPLPYSLGPLGDVVLCFWCWEGLCAVVSDHAQRQPAIMGREDEIICRAAGGPSLCALPLGHASLCRPAVGVDFDGIHVVPRASKKRR